MGVPRRREGGGDVLADAPDQPGHPSFLRRDRCTGQAPATGALLALAFVGVATAAPIDRSGIDVVDRIYNPRIDVTQDATTLYASDRDAFLFLVDDLTRPTRSRRNISPRRTRDRAAPRRRPPRR